MKQSMLSFLLDDRRARCVRCILCQAEVKFERMSVPTVLIISYHFLPSSEVASRRVTALARFLAARNVRVIVVSAFGGQAVRAECEILPGVLAVPVPLPKWTLRAVLVALKRLLLRRKSGTLSNAAPLATQNGEMGRLSKLRIAFFRIAYFIDEYKKWSWYASRAAVRVGRKYQAGLVLSSSPPPSVLLAGTLAAKRLGVPHVADLRDPWTDAPADADLTRVELWLVRLFEQQVMHSAAAITSTGAHLVERLACRYPDIRDKVHVVRNGYDGEPRESPPSTRGRLTVLFAGELYSGRDPFPLLEALERIVARPDVDASKISLTFMGRVEEYRGRSLSNWLRGKRCAAVVALLPRQPQHVVDQAVSDSTVLLNLCQQQHLSVPAKTYEHLASGRENLLLCERDSETAHVVAGIRGVNQVDPRDSSALENTLLELYRHHAVEARLTAPAAKDVLQFSRDCANERFWEVMCLLTE
jgi:hypothetical protein